MKNKKNEPIPWNFYKDNINLYAYWDNLFTKEECEEIIKIAKNKGLKKGQTGRKNENTTNSNIRLSDICWLYNSDNVEWVLRRLTDIIMDLNKRYFEFDIFGMEGLQFSSYKAPSDKFGRHTDRSFNFPIRKLSVSVQLSDPNDYEGGDLILYETEKGTKMKKKQGDLIIFPSFVLHEVTPVTKGERNSLVSWVTGKQFK